MTELELIRRSIEKYPDDPRVYRDALAIFYDEIQHGHVELHAENKDMRKLIGQAMRRGIGDIDTLNDIYWKSMLVDAPVDFDSFMLYLEKNRKPDEKFYVPRRKVLAPIVSAFQEVQDGKLDFLSVSQPKRTGKAVPVDTKVLTPNGYVRIGDLQPGCEVLAINGKKTIVTGVYPQGKKQVYKVTFGETGKCAEYTTVECCEDHLWTVQTEEDRAKGTHRVMSVKDIMNGKMRRGHDQHRNYSVDYINPVEFDMHEELLIKPYTMGVMIAEGGLTGGSIRFATNDNLIVGRVMNEVFPDIVMHIKGCDYKIKNHIHETNEKGYPVKSKTGKALVHYGLWEKYAYEKHIPKEYLYASINDRIQLLRGLFDSDGSAVNNGAEYSTTSEQLAKDVCFLVRSLGGRCRTVSRMGSYYVNGKKKETRTNYRLFCKFPAGFNPFWIARKAEKCKSKIKTMHHFIDSIEATDEYKEMVCISIADESKQYIIGDSMIPTHNTTVGNWFVLFKAGQSPNGRSLCVGSGDMLVGSFYKGMLEILQQTDKYSFYEIFPDAKLVETKADDKTFNLKDKTRFATVTCRPIDGQITGSTEATPDGVIYLDDCVKNEEEAVNADRLEFLWDKIRGDVLGRRLEGCPIVGQGTRYSLRDPLGKLQDIAPEMGWRFKILEIPALNDNDESNFEITLHGKRMFTTEYYRHERLLVTSMQWESQFQQRPYEAKGQLFPEDDLNRFFELPLERPDAILAACDTADKGSDSVSMPIGYVYGEDVFVPDVVFNNGTPEYTKPECATKLVKHFVQKAQFESNNAGEYYAKDVEESMKALGGKTSITIKRTISNKSARIEAESDRILKHFYFLDKSKYKPGSEYWAYIKELCAYVRTGKVSHDDAPDGTAMLSEMTRRISMPKAQPIDRPF